MQLEAGKKYTDRRGRVYGPMVQVSDGCHGVFGENRDDYGWYRDGRRSPGKDIQGDLVAEYVEPVKAAEPADNRVAPGEGYRLLTDDEITLATDEREYINDFESDWLLLPQAHERMVGVTVAKVREEWSGIVIRRKIEQPVPVESPDDWVILDPVVYAEHELRKDIDWIFIASWQPVDGYAGCTVDEFILIAQNKVRCLRKDLPPVPPQKPVEPEFPQYYVAGGREHWGLTSYVKRTAADRYETYDLSGKIDIQNAIWGSSTDGFVKRGDWCKITQAEAEARVKNTRTVVLKEWLCWDYGYEDVVMLRWSSADPAVDNGNLSTFDNAHATGNTRTVEIPVT